MNIEKIKQSLPYILKAGFTPHLIGHAGCGKSSVVYQFAKEQGYDSVIELRLGEMSDMGDLLGLADFELNSKGEKIATKFMRPSFLPKSGRHVIFLDEINRANKDILQGVFQLVYDRKIHEYQVPKDTAIIAASNPNNGDYAVIDFADPAFQDRFVHIKFEPQVSEFLSYLKAKNGDNEIVEFFQDQPEMLQNTTLKDFDLNFVQPSNRSAERLSILKQTGMPDELFNEVMIGVVGPKVAIAYQSFVNDPNRIKISGLEVLNDFSKAKKKLDAIFKVNSNRTDVFFKINEDIKLEAAKLQELTKEQEDNMEAYFLTMPAEILYGTLKNESFLPQYCFTKTVGDDQETPGKERYGLMHRLSFGPVNERLKSYLTEIEKVKHSQDKKASKASKKTK